MKRVIKKIIPAVCMTSILFSAGCTGTTDTKKENVEKQAIQTEIGKEKVSRAMKMKVTAAKIVKDETVSEQEEVVQIQFDIKNEGNEDNGIGAGDFVIKDEKGKTYEMYGREDNFGDVIPAGKSLKGNGYYRVAKDTKELKVVYSPTVQKEKDEKVIEWNIGHPEK
ncbi:DUF4352 domain-containing protein [Bacillus cereus group sp. RP43]|uniref:DUF4352 domain-containing protein n=1 Tax=Bacillus cereus group sp. RP43 TaxID=3040260 RepID=UPI0033991A69